MTETDKDQGRQRLVANIRSVLESGDGTTVSGHQVRRGGTVRILTPAESHGVDVDLALERRSDQEACTAYKPVLAVLVYSDLRQGTSTFRNLSILRRHPDLQQIVALNRDLMRVESYRRNADGWKLQVTVGPESDFYLTTVDRWASLSEIYDGVALGAPSLENRLWRPRSLVEGRSSLLLTITNGGLPPDQSFIEESIKEKFGRIIRDAAPNDIRRAFDMLYPYSDLPTSIDPAEQEDLFVEEFFRLDLFGTVRSAIRDIDWQIEHALLPQTALQDRWVGSDSRSFFDLLSNMTAVW